MTVAVLAVLLGRVMLVVLFLPFSALDKILDFRGAVGQAREIAPGMLGTALILAGLSVEVFGSLAIVTGIGDRIAGLVLAGYCAATAVLWKRFWASGDFWAGGDSTGRQLFWDFMKNFALAGGFLLVTVGPTAETAQDFLNHPLRSSHPYAVPGR